MKLRQPLAFPALFLLGFVYSTSAWSDRRRIYERDRGRGSDYPQCTVSALPTPTDPLLPPTNPANATVTSNPSPSSTSSTNTTSAFTGDTQCFTSMCVSAIVNGNSTVTYILQSTDRFTLGWMGIGYGSQMANTPMVILWSNSDGSISLSQRQASGHVMPILVSTPPRTATLINDLSTPTSSSNIKFAFNIPANSDTNQDLIYAFGSTNPGSSSNDASIIQHAESGTMQLNLQGTKGSLNPVNPSSGTGSGSGSNPGTNNTSSAIPYKSYERKIMAHAFFSGFGYLILLPIGALVARWLRLALPTKWFKIHAIIQFWTAGPFILIGFALGLSAVQSHGTSHFDSAHKRLGLILFIFYWVLQVPSGAFIHYIKFPGYIHRPPQNYGHVAFGLLIIVLSCAQVWLGFQRQWNESTGRGNAPRGTYIFWVFWLVLIWVSYFLGLSLVNRQYRMEADTRDQENIRRKVEQPITDANENGLTRS